MNFDLLKKELPAKTFISIFALFFLCQLHAYPQVAATTDSGGTRLENLVVTSGCDDGSIEPTPIANARIKGLHLNEKTQFTVVLEILNETDAPIAFCQPGAVSAVELKEVNSLAQARKVEVTVLENGRSLRIALLPGGTLPAFGPNHESKTTRQDPWVLEFVPLTMNSEEVIVIVTKSYRGAGGVVYGPGKYQWQKGKLIPIKK